jgi:hypothetical protein
MRKIEILKKSSGRVGGRGNPRKEGKKREKKTKNLK